jgi:hypothetical protein
VSKHPDDPDKAFELILLANDSFEGILKEYNPHVKLLGAVNRNMTTCYLDALLFAMFARLDSFEAMLFDHFADEPRKKLAACLRLWVNLLRTGRLITVELVRRLSTIQQSYTDSVRQNTFKMRLPSADGKAPPKCANRTPRRLSLSSLTLWSCRSLP